MRLDLMMASGRTIIAATPEDVEKLKQVREGDLLPVVIEKPRNYRHTAKFFALVAWIAHHSPHYNSSDEVKRVLKYRTHHFDETVTRDGEIVYEMRSISNRAMDEGEFRIWSRKARDVIATEMIPDILGAPLPETEEARERLLREAEEWLKWD